MRPTLLALLSALLIFSLACSGPAGDADSQDAGANAESDVESDAETEKRPVIETPREGDSQLRHVDDGAAPAEEDREPRPEERGEDREPPPDID